MLRQVGLIKTIFLFFITTTVQSEHTAPQSVNPKRLKWFDRRGTVYEMSQSFKA